jgi:hypothetical protein
MVILPELIWVTRHTQHTANSFGPRRIAADVGHFLFND